MKEQKRVKAAYPLAILSLILLCNPSVGVVDVLPDFIACFILARLLSPGVERAPYFEEAKSALMRLGWLSVGRLGGLMVIGYSRMQNSFGNDTSVVVVTVFSAAELMLSISAARAVFNALFALGERTDMNGTIRDVGKTPANVLPVLTYTFFGLKAILNVIPSFFLLTRISDDGVISTVAKGYVFALTATTVIVLACGIAWCVKMIKYAKAIHKEGQFYTSIYMLSTERNETILKSKAKCARMKSALTLLPVGIVTLIDVKFDNTDGINLVPNFIFGIIALFSILRLRGSVSKNVAPAFLLGAAYTVISLESFLTESYFLYTYGYSALLDEGVAHSFYNAVEILSVLELIALSAFSVALGKLLVTFACENTALPPSDGRYSRADADYHRTLRRKIAAMVAMIITVGSLRCATVFSNGFARLVLNQQATATVSSALPWIGPLATAVLVFLIFFSYYLFSSLKEDVDMKYGGEV